MQSNVLLIQEMRAQAWLAQWLDILEGDYVISEDITFSPTLSHGNSPRKGKHGKLRRKSKKRRGF